jgi:hypothetical protein
MNQPNRLRGLAAALGAIALLMAMAAPASANGPSPDAATIVARLAANKDPDAAFLKLSAGDRQAVIEYLTVAYVTGGSPGPASADPGMMTTAAGGCWTWTWNRQGRNLFGQVIWQFNQRMNWCSNGSTLTSKTRTVWASNMWFFWSYSGLVPGGDSQSGGVGYSYWRSFVQGEFKYCPPGVGCIQYNYPWLDMTARANGTGTGSGGG